MANIQLFEVADNGGRQGIEAPEEKEINTIGVELFNLFDKAPKINATDKDGKPTLAAKAMYHNYKRWYDETVRNELDRFRKIEPYKSSMSKNEWNEYYNKILSMPAVVKYDDETTDFDMNKDEYIKKLRNWIVDGLGDVVQSKIPKKSNLIPGTTTAIRG